MAACKVTGCEGWGCPACGWRVQDATTDEWATICYGHGRAFAAGHLVFTNRNTQLFQVVLVLPPPRAKGSKVDA